MSDVKAFGPTDFDRLTGPQRADVNYWFGKVTPGWQVNPDLHAARHLPGQTNIAALVFVPERRVLVVEHDNAGERFESLFAYEPLDVPLCLARWAL